MSKRRFTNLFIFVHIFGQRFFSQKATLEERSGDSPSSFEFESIERHRGRRWCSQRKEGEGAGHYIKRERGREAEKEGGRETKREAERGRETERGRQKERDRQRVREGGRERRRDRKGGRKRDGERQREREKGTQRDGERKSEREEGRGSSKGGLAEGSWDEIWRVEE